MAVADKQFIDGLKKDILLVEKNVSFLLWDRKMFDDYRKMLKANPAINTRNAFHDFVKDCYVKQCVLGICWQIDKGERSASLRNVIVKIRDNYKKITREWFRKSWEKEDKCGNGVFEMDPDPQAIFGREHIDAAVVIDDIKRLDEKTEAVKKYRDKKIGHFDRGQKPSDMTFSDLDPAIDVINELACKYQLLLCQHAPSDYLPQDLTEYQGIFRQPWIVDKQKDGGNELS